MQIQRYKDHAICPIARQDAAGAWTLTVCLEVCQSVHTVIRSLVVEQPFPSEAEARLFGFAYGKQRIDAGTVWEDPPVAPALGEPVPPPRAA
jgi:hypothetical protein